MIGEYYGANLDFKNLRKNLHKSKRLKKDCTDRNNRQNNDIYGVTKINGLLYDIAEFNKQESSDNPNLTEDALIEFIDLKNKSSE